MRKRLSKVYNIILTAGLVAAGSNALAQKTMSGIVTGPDNEPLTAALIYVEGTNIATVTSTTGEYTLRIPKENDDDIVVAYYNGYIPQRVQPINGEVNIILPKDVEENRIEATYVTTQKRLQKDLDVPIAVGVVDNDKYYKLSINDLEDVSRYIPGFQSTVQNSLCVNNVIRGVSSDGSNSYFQPRISVYLDGVSVTRTSVAGMALYDMERIEIVKGPQGTLFGLGAENGAISYVTQKPKNDFEGFVGLNYGSYLQRGADLMLNLPLNDKVQDRIAIHYNANNGYYKNYDGDGMGAEECKFNDIWLNGRNSIALRNSTKYTPNPRTWMNLTVDIESDDEPGTMYKCPGYGTLDDPYNVSPFTYASFNNEDELGCEKLAGGINFEYNRKLWGGLDLQSITAFRAYTTSECYDADGTCLPLLNMQEDISGQQFSEEVKLNWDNGGKVRGFVGASFFYENYKHKYDIGDNLQKMFPVMIAPSLKTKFQTLGTKLGEGISQRILGLADQLTIPEGYEGMVSQVLQSLSENCRETIKANMGTQLEKWFLDSEWKSTPNFYEDTKSIVEEAVKSAINDVYTTYPQLAALMGGSAEEIVAGMNVGSYLTELEPYSNQELTDNYDENETDYFKTTEGDIYADITWNFMEDWYLTFGIRGTYAHFNSGYMSTSMSAPIVNSIIYQTTNGETIWADKNELSCVGRLAINYMLTPTTNLYASVARGRRPGTVYFNGDPQKKVELDPETIVSYEIGAKGSFYQNRLNYTAAAYFYQWLKFQSYGAITEVDGTKSYESNNNGKAYCLGFEGSVKYYFPKILTLSGDYAFTDSHFNKKDMNGDFQMYRDMDLYEKENRFRLTPMHAGDVIADFDFPVKTSNANNKRRMSIYFCESVTFQSEIYFDNDNTEKLNDDYPLKNDAYMLLNTSAGIRWRNKKAKYNVGLWGKNLTDTQYIIDAGNAGQVINFSTFIPGSPRTFGVKLAIEF